MKKLFVMIILGIFVPKLINAQEKTVSYDFLNGCNAMYTWIGNIYGINETILDGQNLPMAECHTNGNFDLIWVPSKKIDERKKISCAQLNEYLFDKVKNGFEYYPCYVFVIRKKEPLQKKSDTHFFDYIFPSNVIVFKGFDNKWEKLFEQKVSSIEELGALKLKTILTY